MTYKESIYSPVEEIMIQGTYYPAKGPCAGEIFFIHGIFAPIRAYDRFFQALTEKYDVLAFNLRGHGKSEGRFDPTESIEDVIELCHRYPVEKRFLMGHSLGATISVNAASEVDYDAHVLLTPFIDRKYLPWHLRLAVLTLDCVSGNPITNTLDKLSNPLIGILGKLGSQCSGVIKNLQDLEVQNPICSYGSLNSISMEGAVIRPPALYCLSDQDGILGTHKKRMFKAYQAALEGLGYVTDGSHLLSGLNHSFNKTEGDFFPIYKNEPGKDNSFVEGLLEFLEGL